MANLIFGRDGAGRMRHIATVVRGLACRCRCIDCDDELIAKKGAVRDHHFAHLSAAEHDWSWESHLHAWAKQLIVDRGGLAVPLHAAVASHIGLQGAATYANLTAGAPIEQEVRVGGLRPDLVLSTSTGRVSVALEVRVTHACGQEKVAAFGRLQLAALEIDLSRFAPHTFDVGKAEEAVLRELTNKRWLWPLPPRTADRPDHAALPASPNEEAPRPAEIAIEGPPPPLPAEQILQFRVRAWNATVDVSIRHAGVDAIQVNVRDFVTGRLPVTSTELAAPRIVELVGNVIDPQANDLARRSNSWIVGAHNASRVAHLLEEAQRQFERDEEVQYRVNAAALKADVERWRDNPRRSPGRGSLGAPTSAPSDNAYSRRRG